MNRPNRDIVYPARYSQATSKTYVTYLGIAFVVLNFIYLFASCCVVEFAANEPGPDATVASQIQQLLG